MTQRMVRKADGCELRRGRTWGASLAALVLLLSPWAHAADGRELWQAHSAAAASARGQERGADDSATAEVRPVKAQRLALNRGGMASLLAGAPMERTAKGRSAPLVVSLP